MDEPICEFDTLNLSSTKKKIAASNGIGNNTAAAITFEYWLSIDAIFSA